MFNELYIFFRKSCRKFDPDHDVTDMTMENGAPVKTNNKV